MCTFHIILRKLTAILLATLGDRVFDEFLLQEQVSGVGDVCEDDLDVGIHPPAAVRRGDALGSKFAFSLQSRLPIKEVLEDAADDGSFFWLDDQLVAFPAVTVNAEVAVRYALFHALANSPFYIVANLTIELTNEEAFYLDKQIQKGAKGTLLEYVLKNRIDMNKYEDFVSMAAELSEKVEEKLAYMMKLACEFNNLVYMARVRFNVMLSEEENEVAVSEWDRLKPQVKRRANVDLSAVFNKLELHNPGTYLFLSKLQEAFKALDIDAADELIKKRERQLKGINRAKLNRTKEFDHSKWVGGGELDYRFSNARRIINDIYSGEVSSDV